MIPSGARFFLLFDDGEVGTGGAGGPGPCIVAVGAPDKPTPAAAVAVGVSKPPKGRPVRLISVPSVELSAPCAEVSPPVGPPPVASIPSIDILGVFGFLGFGQTSPRSLASACLRSNSDFVGLPRFFRGGSIGLMVTGIGTGGCWPFTPPNRGRG